MKHSEQTEKLDAAMAKAQGAIGVLVKSETAKAGQYEYTWATLAGTIAIIRGPLSENGISWRQGLEAEDGIPVVVTRLSHAGQYAESTTPMPAGNKSQERGSAYSYARRYSLQAMCGIAAEDDDGAAAHNSAPPPPKARKQAPPKPAANPIRERVESLVRKYMSESDLGWDDVANAAKVPVKNLTPEEWLRLGDYATQKLDLPADGGTYGPES